MNMVKFLVRMLREVPLRLLWKFVYNFCFKGARAVKRFEKRKKVGGHFPAFMVISLTNRCNLTCQGCWVNTKEPYCQISPEQLNNIINECKRNGSYFFGLLGGEPLLYTDLFEVIEAHKDCYFQLFTNGTLLSYDIALELKRLGNVTPLISIEGSEVVSDIRRGGTNVYSKALEAVDNCHRAKLITGVATSVCQSNFDDLVQDRFIDELIARKVHYLWYYIYRAVGPRPNPQLAMDSDQILKLREFIVTRRCSKAIALVDAYWDGDGNALCPGAIGLSHHINPFGDIEFCPPMQFSCDKLNSKGDNIGEILENSKFLNSFREFVAKETRGCILLNNPQKLSEFLSEHGAIDSSARNCGLSEIDAMSPLPCHHQEGRAIPEKSWIYKIAKKFWFFGFGAYG